MIYQLKNRFPANFINMIIGRCTLNIGDSLYLIAFSYAIIKLYDLSAGEVATVTLLSRLPLIFSFSIGEHLNKISNKKRFLIFTQVIHILLIFCVTYVFLSKSHVYILYFLNTIFYFVNNISNAINSSIIPQSLNYDDALIEKSVDVQYFASNSLDIISNFIGSLLLLIISYANMMIISVFIIIFGLVYINKLDLSSNEDYYLSDTSVEDPNDKKRSSHVFMSNKLASFIIITESILSGATDLLLTLTPLYLLNINVDLSSIGIVYGIRRLADLLGAGLAPKIKLNHADFFCYDYILSGSLLTLVFILDNIFWKTICYAMAFTIIGISGNVFEKLVYASYPSNELSGIYTIISSLFSFFGVIFLLIPYVYSDIHILGILINVSTVLTGIVLLLFIKTKTIHKTKEN